MKRLPYGITCLINWHQTCILVEVRRASDYIVQLSCTPVFALDLPMGLRSLRLLEANLSSKAKVKEQAKIVNDSNSFGTTSSAPHRRGPTFSKVPFTADLALEAIPTALHNLCQNQYQVGFSLLNLIPTCSDSVSIFLQLPHLFL